MEKAKQAVASFISKDGKHTTTVEEDSRKAITEEHVRPHQHEEVTTAVDKEIHQDHHHTTIQPITAKETLAEQHTHNLAPVEHKTFEHGNEEDLRATLDRDAAKFKDSSVTHSATHSSSVAPVISGEHTHHHVHEHVQPVIQKETIAPHVVHTTMPVHETHHAAAVHHGTSVLPAETLESFNSRGKGTLEARNATKVTEFDGCPKPYKDEFQKEQLDADKNMHFGSGKKSSAKSSAKMNMVTRAEGDQANYTLGGTSSSGLGGTTKAGSLDKSIPRGATDIRQTRSGTSNTGTTQAKPSLMDKINPMKDTDKDGKSGIMD